MLIQGCTVAKPVTNAVPPIDRPTQLLLEYYNELKEE